MAFTTGGIAAEMEKFEKFARGAPEACEKAVKAGGKVLAEKLAEAAPVHLGKLKKSIKVGKVTYSAAKGYSAEVKPVGKNRQGESLAMIGNILEYGRSKVDPQPWFNPTILKAVDEVNAAMAETFAKAQGGDSG